MRRPTGVMTRSGHCAYPTTLVRDPEGDGYISVTVSHERCQLATCSCECHGG